jgi:hypothetical protein
MPAADASCSSSLAPGGALAGGGMHSASASSRAPISHSFLLAQNMSTEPPASIVSCVRNAQ